MIRKFYSRTVFSNVTPVKQLNVCFIKETIIFLLATQNHIISAILLSNSMWVILKLANESRYIAIIEVNGLRPNRPP